MTDQNTNPTEQRVKSILAERSGIDIDQITADSDMHSDLALDSLDSVEAIMEFETAFGITISDERAEKIKTVRDATKVIDELLDQKK